MEQRVGDTINPNTQQESTPQAVDASFGQGTDQHFNAQPMYATTPAAEKLRSDASTARLLSFLSFLFGGLLLSGGMWFWANNMLQEAQMLGAPIDVVDQARSAQSTAKICSIIHIGFIVAGLVIGVIFIVLGLIVAGAAGH